MNTNNNHSQGTRVRGRPKNRWMDLCIVRHKKKKTRVCLRPHGRSENFIKARFIIRKTTVFTSMLRKQQHLQYI